MTNFGQSLQPMNPGLWPGADHESVADRGESFLRRIVNGYVRGKEIRTWPGWKCVANPVIDSADQFKGALQVGYRAPAIDARRPVARRASVTDKYPLRIAHEEEMQVYADPVNLHGFHPLRGRVAILGESSLRIEPIINASSPTVPLEIISFDESASHAGQVRLQFSAPIVGASGTFNNLQAGDALFIADLASDTAQAACDLLNGRSHFVVEIAAGGVTLQTIYTADSGVLTSNGRCGRTMGNLTGNLGNGKRVYGEPVAGEAIQDRDSLTCWWIDDDIDVDGDPVRAAHAAYVANRQRDFADHTKDTPVATVQVPTRLVEGYTPFAFQSFTPVPNWGITRRPTLELPFRLVSAVGGDRIVAAARGYGCLFQIPCKVPVTADLQTDPFDGAWEYHNSVYDRPRMLGVPKGQILEASFEQGLTTDPLSATPIYHDLHFTERADALGFLPGTYRVAIAYRDDATGEVGDLSEVWEFTIPAIVIPPASVGTQSYDVHLPIMHPGYVMAECLAMSVMLFMSERNADSLQHVMTFQLGDQNTAFSGGIPITGSSQSSQYGLNVWGASSNATPTVPRPIELFNTITLPIEPLADSELFNPDILVPDIFNMPRGGKFVSITRGVMVSGGIVGSYGRDRELMIGTARLFHEAVTGVNRENIPSILTIPRMGGQGASQQIAPWPVANGMLPSSYGGMPVISQSLFPYPVDRQELNRMLNPKAAKNGTAATRESIPYMSRWDLIEQVVRLKSGRQAAPTAVFAQQLRAQLQTSELGQFGLTLSIGDIITDPKKDDDVEAGSEFRGVLVFCSKRQTFSLAWQVGPSGSVPFTVSNEFGCIAPSTMVEGDAILAWISARGPVAYTPFGSVEQIGRQYTRDFTGRHARFLRDSNGMMLHSWAAHDEERGLLLFGVFENRHKGTANEVSVRWKGQDYLWDAAPDEVKSRFPCDVVLAYSESTRAWSEWQPPAGLEVLGMGSVRCKDGQLRMAFLARDKRLYVLDDDFGDTNREPLILIVNDDHADVSIVNHGSAIGQTSTYLNGNGAFLRNGAPVLIYDLENKLRYETTGQLVSGVPGQIQLGQNVTVKDGWKMLVMPKSMTIETGFINRKGSQSQRISKVMLRGQPRSRIQTGGLTAVAQPVWARATITKQTPASGLHGGGVDRKKPTVMHTGLGEYIGSSEFEGQNRFLALDKGSSDGLEQIVTVEVFGGAQFCCQDLVLSVG